MIPIVVLGVSVALKVAQTGILLTLAFDLMLAGLLVLFILGLFWKRGGTRAAVAALVVVSRCASCSSCSPPPSTACRTTSGTSPTTCIHASFYGWPTFWGFGASLLAYLVAAAVWPRTVTEEAGRSPTACPTKPVPVPRARARRLTG